MQKKKKSTKQMGPKPQYTRKEPKGPRIIAVSYTHLDVYKRQVLVYP